MSELVKVDDGEPVFRWALDMAADLSGWRGWDGICQSGTIDPRNRRAVIAHARTLTKYETPPVDPAELKRWQDAREAAAVVMRKVWTGKAIEDLLGGRDDIAPVKSAYIALCHRDGVEPQDKAPGGVA